MTDTPMMVYTHSAANSVNIYPIAVSGSLLFPGKSVERQQNKVGISVDPNQEYRTLKCTCKLTSTDLNTLVVTYLMPSSAPTYDATYPNVTLKISGSTTWTVKCMVTGLDFTHQADNRWIVTITFTERSL